MDGLITELILTLKSMNIQEDDILYVALNESFWMPWDEFIKLKNPPHVWEPLCNGKFITWDTVTSKFRVVLKDLRWIDYSHCCDEYYSEFVLHESKEKPMNQYFEPGDSLI